MKTSRQRLRLAAILGIAALVILGVAFALGGGTRGAGYYFPHWVGAEWDPAADAEKRAGELTNITSSLPIVLEAAEATPSGLGNQWTKLLERLPEPLQKRLPQYVEPDDQPLLWLTLHGPDKEVAAAISHRWTRWPETLRAAWLGAVESEQITNRTEYLPLLYQSCRSTNEDLAIPAVGLILGFRPFTDENAKPVAEALLQPGRMRSLFSDLIGPDSVPPVMMQALQAELICADPEDSFLAALVLAKVDPSAFPPRSTLEPFWSRLDPEAAARVLATLTQPEIRSLATSEWAVDFLARLLTAKPGNEGSASISNPKVDPLILTLLEQAGPSAAKAVPAIATRFSDPNRLVRLRAAMAFAAVAPPRPEYLPMIQKQFTNPYVVAPLLLWLTSMGTNATSVFDDVSGFTDGSLGLAIPIPIPKPSRPFVMDPALMYRYGLVPRPVETPSQTNSEVTVSPETHADIRRPAFSFYSETRIDPALARRYGLVPDRHVGELNSLPTNQVPESLWKPGVITVSARISCPPGLIHLWPGYEETRAAVRQQFPKDSPGPTPQQVLGQLPRSNLAELARRTLAAITNGVPMPPAEGQ